MQRFFDILIVGGGHGGAQAAIALRQAKFDGTIAIVGDEPDLPYERPPLSKEYLAGEKDGERLLIRSAAFWAERAIAMILGRRVVQVDAGGHAVVTADGERIGYGKLVWAAGGRPRRMSCAGHDLRGVHALRTRADADRMRAELPAARRAVVIGGGYIGLEAAAVLSARGIQVCLLEAQDRVLARVVGEPLSRFYEAEHRARGVEVRLNAVVDCLVGSGGAVSGVRMADGEELPADLVVVGIGIAPSVEPLLEAGAAGANGVVVDAQCRTSLPDIFAIGDCALHPSVHAGGALARIESVQNAVDQANVAAKVLTGTPAAYEAVPWFWSNQYDLKLQTVGLSAGHDAALIRGAPAERSFSVIYLKGGRVIALDCVNATKDYVQGRKLITDGPAIDPERLADASVPLKQLLAEHSAAETCPT